jgi:EpsI family protein
MQEIRRAGYILIGILGVALCCAFAWRPAPPAKFTGLAALNVPTTVNGYVGKNVPVDSVTRGILASADIMSREYRNPAGNVIDLTMIGGTDRSALHDPRSCLVGAGWTLDDDRVETLPNDPSVRVRTCTADIQDPDATSSQGVDIMYLYVTHGHIIASATEIRIALLEAALFDQSDSPVYFIRLTTMLPASGFNETEHAQLAQFAQGLWSKIGTAVLNGGRK